MLRSGAFVTRRRLRVYAVLILGIGIAALAVWAALSDGLVDRNGKPLGTDFSNVYAAGTLVRQGHPADAYDPERQHAAEIAVFAGRTVPFFGWHYPPFFLAVAALLAHLPYPAALLVWLLATGLAYGATVRAILARAPLVRADIWLATLAFPAVFVNVGHGQNGFLTAALLGSGLNLLERRPVVAGILIGLMAYKPQFGVLIPVALLAAGRWSTIAAAGATVAALGVATVALMGAEIWPAFAASTRFTQQVVLEEGALGWEKAQSIFAAARLWGFGLPVAYGLQLALALALAATLAWLWHSTADFDLKAAALACACLLATPYVLDYDLVVLAVAIAFFVRHGLSHGFRDYEIGLLVAAWFMPLLARSVMTATAIPLGLIALLALYLMLLRRARADLAGVGHTAPAGAETPQRA
ncbi:MAG: glycosyltransferase family 87 protein [Xanthobacteraceae bacterium]|nr:glycosyltransferase family 87 protein [Xanthobacteraceae bacterium]